MSDEENNLDAIKSETSEETEYDFDTFTRLGKKTKEKFHQAIVCGQYDDVLQILTKTPLYIDCTNAENEETGLMKACMYHRNDIVQLLLQYRADVTKRNRDGECPLLVSIKYKNLTAVQLLIAKGYYYFNPFNRRSRCNEDPLIYAVTYDDASILKWLLDQEFCQGCVNNTDKDKDNDLDWGNGSHQSGNTALHHASLWDKGKMVKILLDANASVVKKNSNEETAYDIAVRRKCKNSLKEFARHHVGECKTVPIVSLDRKLRLI